jgi:MSHA biogenesis protein MshI
MMKFSFFHPKTTHNQTHIVSLEEDELRFIVCRVGQTKKIQITAWGEVRLGGDQTLSQSLGQTHLSRVSDGVLMLGTDDYLFATLDAPRVPAAELGEALRWKAKDLIDYPVEEAIVESIAVPLAPDSSGTAVYAHIAVTRTSQLAEVIQQLDDSGFSASVVDVRETAQRNMANHLLPQISCQAVLYVGMSYCLFTVNFNGALLFSRRIDVSAQQIQAVDHALRHAALEGLLLEVHRSLDSVARRFSFAVVTGLQCVGEIDLNESITFLAEHLEIPIHLLPVSQGFEFKSCPVPDLCAQGRLFHLFGAALRDVEAIR